MGLSRIFSATLQDRRPLSSLGSSKDVFHLRFSVSPQNCPYEPGDSIALYAENLPKDVSFILKHFAIAPDKLIGTHGKSAAELLKKSYAISQLPKSFFAGIEKYLSPQDYAKMEQLQAENEAFQLSVSLIDFLKLFPSLNLPDSELFVRLKKMQPRLYSIASSAKISPEIVELAVVVAKYRDSDGKEKLGVCSNYICRFLAEGNTIQAMHIPSKFKLPATTESDVIMVGPGTGIAPFRSFLQERGYLREQGGNVGRNWLFFGDHHEKFNFYYRSEFENMLANGTLTRLDLAFSRDQAEKIYVQDRLREKGKIIWKWIDAGACFYICGDALHMAKDVENTLLDIIREYGNIAQPEEYLRQMKKDNRYQKDVY